MLDFFIPFYYCRGAPWLRCHCVWRIASWLLSNSSFGVGSIVQTNQTTLKLLMAATVERNVQESSATSPVTRVEPAPTPPAPGPRRLGDGWHPWHSVAGLMGYGRRGTLRNKHIFTLCFKFVLGIGQVILKAYVHCVCLS
jgi:hypothetical protein